MIIIADSGSTKTHWCRVDEKGVRELITPGLNPRLTDQDTIMNVMSHARKALGRPDELFFYGSGCGTKEIQQRMVALLSIIFTQKAVCHCEGDLLGACRALCGDDAGMVGILGTGSNLCYYDGKKIARQQFSTGYLLGDEGSGNHIGKRLLKDYLEKHMPPRVRSLFFSNYRLSDAEFLDQLYSQPYPNRFLAMFAEFAAQHQTNKYVATVLHDCFAAYFAQMDYFGVHRHQPLNLVGGIVKSFAPTLKRVAKQCHVKVGVLMPDPIEGLQKYHSR